eukprot:7376394-Prymnesium_polylepis.3
MQTITNMLQNIGRGGTGRIDSSALAPLLSQLDTNGDGKVDINDLPENMRGALSQVQLRAQRRMTRARAAEDGGRGSRRQGRPGAPIFT